MAARRMDRLPCGVDVLKRIEQGWIRAGPAYTAMAEAMAVACPGQEMRYAGQGESIPLCDTLVSLYPLAEILLIGVSEPQARIHAVDDSVSPGEPERLPVAEALFPYHCAAC